MKRCDLTKGLVFFLTIIITLCCGVIPSSWADHDDDVVCTNESLHGTYGFSQSGTVLVPTKKGPEEHSFYCVGIFKANGQGGIEGVETITAGGDDKITFESNFEGTYEIGSDCRGIVYVMAETPIEGVLMPIETSVVICGQNKSKVHMLNTLVGDSTTSVLGIGIKITNDD